MLKRNNKYSKFVYFMGGLEGGKESADKQEGEAPGQAPAGAPKSEAQKAKEEAAGMAKGADSGLTELKDKVSAKHENKPFTKDEIEKKVGKKKEKGRTSEEYKALKQYFPQIEQKILDDYNKRRPEGVPEKTKVEHGDTGSIHADLGEGEKEFVLLVDETGKPEERLFT